MTKIKDVMARFFFEAKNISGAEKTFHALFYHHLLEASFPHTRIAREYRIARKSIDFVIFDRDQTGDFADPNGRATQAFEFKGGAYGDRNALRDQVNPRRGRIEDIDKLAAIELAELNKWFICIDLRDPGIALGGDDVTTIARMASDQGVHFVYFDQTADHFIAAPASGKLRSYPLEPIASGRCNGSASISLGKDELLLDDLLEYAGSIRGSEDNNVALIYHHLRQSGFTAEQLSLETYFGFANRKSSRMQWRPDISVFDPAVRGLFNLYRQGDRRRSNDIHKLVNLRALIEVKGSTATHKYSDARLHRTYQDDLDKFVRWKTLVTEAKQEHDIRGVEEPSYVFFGFDKRSKPLSVESRSELESFCHRHQIEFHYLHTP